MSYKLVRELLYKSESSSLDFKEAQYVFTKADVHLPGATSNEVKQKFELKKSELLKDILAMANSWRDGPAYIVLGVIDKSPEPAVVAGLDESKVYDDAQFQQFINSKTNVPLSFSYEAFNYDGKIVALLTIPPQARPLYAIEKFGIVEADTVYVRRGSSTAIAKPDEIASMGEANFTEKKKPKVSLSLQDKNCRNLLGSCSNFTRVDFEEKALPDYSPRITTISQQLSPLGVNTNYWRQLAACVRARKQALAVLGEIFNDSPFSLTEATLHISVQDTGGALLKLGKYEDEISVPETYSSAIFGKALVPLAAKTWLKVDKKKEPYLSVIRFDTILPGASAKFPAHLLVMPINSGEIVFSCKLFAKELASPLTFEVKHEVLLETAETWDNSKFELFHQRLSNKR